MPYFFLSAANQKFESGFQKFHWKSFLENQMVAVVD
jgi:hypothetical protein